MGFERQCIQQVSPCFQNQYSPFSGLSCCVHFLLSVPHTLLPSQGPVALSTLSVAIQRVCPYFTAPAGPNMSKPALTALTWSILVSRDSEKTNDVMVKSQVRGQTPPSHAQGSLFFPRVTGFVFVLYFLSFWCFCGLIKNKRHQKDNETTTQYKSQGSHL